MISFREIGDFIQRFIFLRIIKQVLLYRKLTFFMLNKTNQNCNLIYFDEENNLVMM